MDTETANKVADQADQQIALIRARMPKTYAAIKARAAEVEDTYRLVRQGARGELGCFYACENDIKVGTYWHVELATDVANLVERYGMSFVCMWGKPAKPKETDGAH